MTVAHSRPVAALLAAVAVLTLSGCAASSTQNPVTPPAPTPPQITVANAVNALAQTLDAAVTALQAARTNGKISAADVAAAEKVAAIIATAGKSINAELRSVDTWEVQKLKILQIVTSSGITGALANVPPAACAILTAGVALFNPIAQTVGGPVII